MTPGTTIRYVSVLISAFGLTAALGLRRIVAIGKVGLSSSLDGRDGLARIEKASERLGSMRAADGTGEHWIMLISSSLTAFLNNSCFVVEGDPSP
jgi:hypothetical protein